ncbi:ABC transporter ATP-binding protein [Bacillus sp. RO1]|uniref:ABC transporter ATP-binding protein n=1 Tax=Bacillus sp. RO1 TaxID=2722703 RepID=UPI0014570571|nr:ABC transporter ATP-binding protein [Bacillus sp. RO1]NLP52266.1 ABC transporter ATP-binding protein [Bacillus sp. RO1]
MIKLDNIYWKYKHFTLEIDDLTLQTGITILVGNNGSGKSTLLHLLATATRAPRGTIHYHDDTMDSALALVRSRIGFVPTGVELYPDFTPLKLLMYMAQLKGLRKDFSMRQIDELLKVFHLEDVKKKKVKKLSQGMQQRLALAQAFLGKPEYIFLDEPLNFLDIHERKSLLNYVAKLAPHCVILVATHELNEWEPVCNKVIWMYQGKVVYSGSKLMWKHQLPLKVWTGELQDSLYEHFSTQHLIVYAGRVKDKLTVRCASTIKPVHGFIEAPPTMEDAFFIRKYTKEAKDR